jgi:hypothetical protein
MPRQWQLLLRERFGRAAGAENPRIRRAFQPYAEQGIRMYAFASECLRCVQCPKISPSPGGNGP